MTPRQRFIMAVTVISFLTVTGFVVGCDSDDTPTVTAPAPGSGGIRESSGNGESIDFLRLDSSLIADSDCLERVGTNLRNNCNRDITYAVACPTQTLWAGSNVQGTQVYGTSPRWLKRTPEEEPTLPNQIAYVRAGSEAFMGTSPHPAADCLTSSDRSNDILHGCYHTGDDAIFYAAPIPVWLSSNPTGPKSCAVYIKERFS